MSITTISDLLDEFSKVPPNTELRVQEGTGVVHQGDIYLLPLPEGFDTSAWTEERPALHGQVAIGDTQGSRHVATGDVSVRWPTDREKAMKAIRAAYPGAFPNAARARLQSTGPVVLARAPWTLTHPEHPHWKVNAPLVVVIYQFNPEENRIVED